MKEYRIKAFDVDRIYATSRIEDKYITFATTSIEEYKNLINALQKQRKAFLVDYAEVEKDV